MVPLTPTPPARSTLLELKGFLEQGVLVPVIGKRFPLVELPNAFRVLSRGHTRGKIVIPPMNEPQGRDQQLYKRRFVMLAPVVISSIFVLGVVILCLTKPDAGRIFLGILFLVMALGVNGYFTFGNPQAYIDYAGGALIPVYRDLALMIVNVSPFGFGLMVILYEVAMGILLLGKGKAVKAGLTGTILFLLGIAPLSCLQIPWLGLMAGQVYLLTKQFDTSVLEMLQMKSKPRE